MERFIKERELQRVGFFTEAALIATWELWKLRNDKIFQRRNPTPALWLSNFKNQCTLQLDLRKILGFPFVFG